MDEISERLRRHYAGTFAAHGATSAGVDWGRHEDRVRLRYDKMLAAVSHAGGKRPSVLDVGCGYGGLLAHARERGLDLDYTGIDVVGEMVEHARREFPDAEFLHGDVLGMTLDRRYDHVVCNGILTQKLDVSMAEMDAYAGRLVRRLFELCGRSAAFNVMSTRVNFFADNLYYRNPAEMLAWLMCEVTPHVRLDHAYPLHEFTAYLFREPEA